MNSTQTTALIIILLYMAATVAIGLFASHRQAAKAGKQIPDSLMRPPCAPLNKPSATFFS